MSSETRPRRAQTTVLNVNLHATPALAARLFPEAERGAHEAHARARKIARDALAERWLRLRSEAVNEGIGTSRIVGPSSNSVVISAMERAKVVTRRSKPLPL